MASETFIGKNDDVVRLMKNLTWKLITIRSITRHKRTAPSDTDTYKSGYK